MFWPIARSIAITNRCVRSGVLPDGNFFFGTSRKMFGPRRQAAATPVMQMIRKQRAVRRDAHGGVATRLERHPLLEPGPSEVAQGRIAHPGIVEYNLATTSISVRQFAVW
jgi:hypothetical protein